jgi:16S rRNA pseudouridine516 synthase
VYLATTKHPLDAEQLDRLLAGVVLNDEPLAVAAAAAEVVDNFHLRLTVTEGKYHQVKRMVAAAGNRVEALHREMLGGLVLPADLKPGEWRWLAAVDHEKLRKSA